MKFVVKNRKIDQNRNSNQLQCKKSHDAVKTVLTGEKSMGDIANCGEKIALGVHSLIENNASAIFAAKRDPSKMLLRDCLRGRLC